MYFHVIPINRSLEMLFCGMLQHDCLILRNIRSQKIKIFTVIVIKCFDWGES